MWSTCPSPTALSDVCLNMLKKKIPTWNSFLILTLLGNAFQHTVHSQQWKSCWSHYCSWSHICNLLQAALKSCFCSLFVLNYEFKLLTVYGWDSFSTWSRNGLLLMMHNSSWCFTMLYRKSLVLQDLSWPNLWMSRAVLASC